MGVHPKLVNITKSIYKNITFTVEIDGNSSTWQTQHTGIRQGCPLSPYLFLIVMIVLFKEVHAQTDHILEKQRVPGATFDEVTYADDTICIATTEKAINEMLKHIEKEGEKYGMKLNKEKCELITTDSTANVHLDNKQQIKKTRKATYLGCEIGIKTTNTEELNSRIAKTMATMKKLDLFWRHSNCPTHIKIYTADAVLRTKLLYGIESTQLTESCQNKLETFQMKVMRKILKIDSTYINRQNSHRHIMHTANEKLKQEGKTKHIKRFQDVYKDTKVKSALRIIRKESSNLHSITFAQNTFSKRIPKNRRVGRPRQNWTEETMKEIWEQIKIQQIEYKYVTLDTNKPEHIELIKEHAQNITNNS